MAVGRRPAAADVATLALVLAALVLVTLSVLHDGGSLVAVTVSAVLLGAAVLVRAEHVSWRIPLTILVLVILFVPIRRYVVSASPGFQLEPYRALVAVLVFVWLGALLVDRRIRLRRTGFEGPLLLVLLATLGSLVFNPGRAVELEGEVVKALAFFLSFLLVLYLLASVLKVTDVEPLLKVLVAGGAVVAVLAIVEARTAWTPFNSLSEYLPFMDLSPSFEPAISRGARLRAFGPAEHPIALGAMLAMLIPLAVYLSRRAGKLWLALTVVLVVGALATVSRTSVLVLAASMLVFLWLRPRETFRLWPLAIVLLVATHFAAPGTLGTLRQAFTPEQGLIAEQQSAAGTTGSGRLADVGPTLSQWAERPLLGYGFGTRITTGPDANAMILDSQWLGTLLETGAIGVAAWIWLFLRMLRLTRLTARDDSGAGALAVALGAAVFGYAVGMFTYDAFGFVQVTFLLFVLLGLAAVVVRESPQPAEADEPGPSAAPATVRGDGPVAARARRAPRPDARGAWRTDPGARE
jgi:O-antigen ligase